VVCKQRVVRLDEGIVLIRIEVNQNVVFLPNLPVCLFAIRHVVHFQATASCFRLHSCQSSVTSSLSHRGRYVGLSTICANVGVERDRPSIVRYCRCHKLRSCVRMFKKFSKRTKVGGRARQRIESRKTGENPLCKFMMRMFRDWKTNVTLGKIKRRVLPVATASLMFSAKQVLTFFQSDWTLGT